MSRQVRRTQAPVATREKTPALVWVVYGLGIAAAAVVLVSALFTAGAYFLSGDLAVGFNVSLLALLVWVGLIALAAGTWLWRRRAGRR